MRRESFGPPRCISAVFVTDRLDPGLSIEGLCHVGEIRCLPMAFTKRDSDGETGVGGLITFSALLFWLLHPG